MDGWTDDLRHGYDAVASEYVARIADELAGKPFDRAVLDRFADAVRPIGPACDVGCGPGHIGRYLHDRGLETSGIDLSPGMIAEARRLNPEMTFTVGSILDLPLSDASLGGIVAFYSIIHIRRDDLSRAFTEFRRVLRPKGRLLLAFHVGDEDRHLEEWFGHEVSMDFLFFTREEIERQLVDAGFIIEESLERDPYAPEVEHQSRRAYILGRMPE